MNYLVLIIKMHKNPALFDRFFLATVWWIRVTINAFAIHVCGGDCGLDKVATSQDREEAADVTIPRTD